MRLGVFLCLPLACVLTLVGCGSNNVSEKDISEQKERIAELETELQAARQDKEKAIADASDESRKEAEERITELESKLQEERDKLSAMQDRSQFENEMVTNLENMGQTIDRLDEQADEATGEREVELRKRIAGLKTKREQLQEKLTTLRAASGDTWAQLKQETEEAWNDARSSVDEATQELKQEVDEKLQDEKTSPTEVDDTESDNS